MTTDPIYNAEAYEERIKSLKFKLQAADHGLEELQKTVSEASTALEDAIDLIESCTITEVPYGFSKTLSRVKEVLSAIQETSI
jgi:hypothetical protein